MSQQLEFAMIFAGSLASHVPAVLSCLCAAVLLPPSTALGQQLDDDWIVSVGGRSVRVNPDGTFYLPNVPVRDLEPPGLVGDDTVQLVGTRLGPVPGYAGSEHFQLPWNLGNPYRIQELTISPIPPPLVDVLALDTASGNRVIQVGNFEELAALADLSDGSQLDVTSTSLWTTYRSSSDDILTIDVLGAEGAPGAGPAGTVVASGHKRGTVYVTATNGGAVSVIRLDVAESVVSTTVEGFVRLEDGSPVLGAQVTTTFSGLGTTDGTGFFQFPVQVPEGSGLSVFASSGLVSGSSGALEVMADGITDAGIIVLRPVASAHLFEFPLLIPGVGHDDDDYLLPDVDSGDFDGDGHTDLVAAVKQGITVYLNTVGDGSSFEIATYEATSMLSTSLVAVGDFDGDGDLDCAQNRGWGLGVFAISVHFNGGTGTFDTHTEMDFEEECTLLAAGDLDGDGVDDIVVSHKFPSELRVFFGTTSGVFGSPAVYPLSSNPGFRMMEVVDLNGDLAPDVVMAMQFGFSVLLNNGAGQLLAEVHTPSTLPGDSYATAVGDVDLDLDPDVVHVYSDSQVEAGVVVYLNDGTGAFVSPPVASVWPWPDVAGSWASLLDNDQDGDLDVYLTRGSYDRVLENNGTGVFSLRPESYLSQAVLFPVKGVDVDGDTWPDLVSRAYPDNIIVLANLGDGTFEKHTLHSVSGTDTVSLYAETGDLTGDGAPDVLYGDSDAPELALLLNDGTGGLTDGGTFPGGPARWITTADLDADMDLDVIVLDDVAQVIRVLLGDGSGGVGGSVEYPTSMSPSYNSQALIATDLDGDGNVDLIGRGAPASVAVMLGNGDGTFGGETLYLLATTGSMDRFVVGDLDGDLDPDVAAPVAPSGQLSVILNNGDGSFGPPSFYSSGALGGDVFLGDFDGDLDLDVVSTRGFPDLVLYLTLNNGDGTFSPSLTIPARGGVILDVGDVDGDNDLDVLQQGWSVSNNPALAFRVLLNSGLGDFVFGGSYQHLSPHGFIRGGGLWDPDGDGDLDLQSPAQYPKVRSGIEVSHNLHGE